jgi:uncharacterized coiled-coil protein SlyX
MLACIHVPKSIGAKLSVCAGLFVGELRMSLSSNRSFFSILAPAALGFLVCVLAGASAPASAQSGPSVRNAEDLMIVDCLLPGQIRQLGRQATYMSARRPIRATQADCQIRGGEYTAYDRANYQTALKVWLEAAMSGDAEAQNNVGEIYAKGLGTEPDYGMAFQWFKKAAEQGFARARINLGWLYEEGLGVERDPAKAINYYREAAGINDELLYASVVQVQIDEKDAQISGLEQDVAREKANADALRQQVDALKSQLAERRGALARARAELAETKKKLDQARQGEDPALAALLENTLLEQESRLGEQRNVIAGLERRVGAGGMLMARLELLDPPVIAMRGKPAAVSRGGPGERTITGRVSGADDVRSVNVNGTDVPVSAGGLFQAKVDAAAAGTPVTLAATNAAGRVARLQFTLLPSQGEGGSGSMPVFETGGASLGSYRAVVIGNDRYGSDAYPDLRSAAKDATAVSQMLSTRYGFEPRLLLNASRLEILTALDDMRKALGPNDNLLVFYAGHGELSDDGQGYWVPVDGVADRPETWISNRSVSEVLDSLQAKRVLVVADSCYSGTMTQASVPVADGSIEGRQWSKWLKEATAGRSRLALTSGGVQPVPDTGADGHSYFARAFLNVLEDNRGVLEATRLYQDVSASLALATLDAPLVQTPEFAPIRFSGHESGTFVLQARSSAGSAGSP